MVLPESGGLIGCPLFIVTGADGESLVSANSSFDRASLTDDQESVQTRTSMASLRRRRLLMTSLPQFSARLRPKRCVVGQTVRFSCCVSGLPEPNVTWSRADGTTLTNSKRVRITVCRLSKSYCTQYVVVGLINALDRNRRIVNHDNHTIYYVKHARECSLPPASKQFQRKQKTNLGDEVFLVSIT